MKPDWAEVTRINDEARALVKAGRWNEHEYQRLRHAAVKALDGCRDGLEGLFLINERAKQGI